MTPEAILLSIRDQSGEGSYRFSCPRCRDTVEKPADRKVAALLLSAGVELDESPPEDDDDFDPGGWSWSSTPRDVLRARPSPSMTSSASTSC